MGMPITGAIAPASPGGGNTAISVTFPDGQMAVISSTATAWPSGAGPYVINVGGLLATPDYTYTCTDQLEQVFILQQISDAMAKGISVVVLDSTAPVPAAGDITLAPTSGQLNGGTQILVTLTAPSPGAAPAKAFRSDGVFFLGGIKAVTKFLNAFTVMLYAPPAPQTGAVNLDYSESRGGLSKATAYTYT